MALEGLHHPIHTSFIIYPYGVDRPSLQFIPSLIEICMIKVTTEAQLGLIGGTMGLLTGFSILSGVEIIYYLLRFNFPLCFCYNLLPRFFMSLRIPRTEVVNAVNNKFGNHLMNKT